jgi:two-component system phosphate regulon sensor histidine kinase PhoR
MAAASKSHQPRGFSVVAQALLRRAAALGRSSDGSPPQAKSSAPLADPRLEERRFAAMLEALFDPVLLVAGDNAQDPAGHRFLFANAAARAMMPIQRPEGLLATAVRAPEVLAAVDQALFGEGVGEASFQSGGVQPRVWRVRAVRLPAASAGEEGLALLTFTDETGILASIRGRADFLANASHELRTPLASLSGFIETLSGHAREDADARERFLPIMQSQADRMRRLIENLMSLSSIEQAEHLAPSAQVDLAAAVSDVIDALGPQARARGVGFEKALAPAASIIGDRDQILQVVQNLAENALKYAPAGGVVTLKVAADLALQEATRGGGLPQHSLLTPAQAPGARYTALRVTDQGRGIARTNLPRLTERFYRVEGQKSGEHSGTGLGLAIVKHIMNRHRGGLCVESAEGEGATFTAYFPAAPGARRPAAGEEGAVRVTVALDQNG